MYSYLTDYLSWIYNYYNYDEQITLKPTEEFINGKYRLCILKYDNKDYFLPDNYVITKIEEENLEKDVEIYYGNNNITPNKKNAAKIDDIFYKKNNYFIAYHINDKKEINDFKINITIRKEIQKERETIKLNTLLYDKVPIYLENNVTKGKKDIALCFSGGGPRSFAASLGYIRALKEMKLMKDIKYVSCVSGSTWAWIPYIYLNKEYDEDVFLGMDKFGGIDRKLTMKDIEYTDEKYLGNSIISLAYNSSIIRYMYDGLRSLGHHEKSRLWPYILGKILLKPYGIMTTDLFTCNENIADIFNNQPLNINQKFRIPYNNDRPFIITNSGIVKTDKRGTLVNTDFNLMVMTPLYSGILNKIEGKNEEKYGGEYINTYGFHALNIKKGEELYNVEIPTHHELNNVERFNLFDMIGSSSTAYGIVTEYLGINFVNPSYRLINKELEKVEYFDCVDGGVLDNTGILPMLQKGMKNIVLFVNSSDRITLTMDDKIMTESIDIMLRQLFLGDIEMNTKTYFEYFDYVNDLKVFKNGEERWKELLMQIRNNIYVKDLACAILKDVEVMENKNFHIEEYKIEKLMIIYLFPSIEWFHHRIDNDIRKLMDSKEYETFPYYRTIFEEGEEIIALEAEKVNMLSDLCYWNLMHLKEFKKMFI